MSEIVIPSEARDLQLGGLDRTADSSLAFGRDGRE